MQSIAPAAVTPTVAEAKPKPVKPKPIPKPKVKVGPASRGTALHPIASHLDRADPQAKHAKKAPPKPILGDDDTAAQDQADTQGLSREQVAKKLGDKLAAEGVAHSNLLGDSGVSGGHPSPFADFYNSIREQITDKWQVPNQDAAGATNPVVQIHVDKDGRVPPEQVPLAPLLPATRRSTIRRWPRRGRWVTHSTLAGPLSA